MKKRYYSMLIENREASINIYGDITSWEWFDSDVSSYTLSKEIEGLDVDVINVFITLMVVKWQKAWQFIIILNATMLKSLLMTMGLLARLPVLFLWQAMKELCQTHHY